MLDCVPPPSDFLHAILPRTGQRVFRLGLSGTCRPGGRAPKAGDCCRLVLSNPNVHVCLMAPRSLAQLKENLAALERGPLVEDDLRFMQSFGDAVHREHSFFL